MINYIPDCSAGEPGFTSSNLVSGTVIIPILPGQMVNQAIPGEIDGTINYLTARQGCRSFTNGPFNGRKVTPAFQQKVGGKRKERINCTNSVCKPSNYLTWKLNLTD